LTDTKFKELYGGESTNDMISEFIKNNGGKFLGKEGLIKTIQENPSLLNLVWVCKDCSFTEENEFYRVIPDTQVNLENFQENIFFSGSLKPLIIVDLVRGGTSFLLFTEKSK
jgi:hypothetical protein